MEVNMLCNETLIGLLDQRAEFETMNEAEMVDFIREVMARKLYLEFGADSMFDFLTRAHYQYAPVVAQRKLDAARAMQLFPEVKSWLAGGEVNLTQLGMFARAVRQKPAALEMQRDVLDSIRNQTVRNTEPRFALSAMGPCVWS